MKRIEEKAHLSTHKQLREQGLPLLTTRTEGAYYNTTDLNRVEAAAKYISDRLNTYGYENLVITHPVWKREDFPTRVNMEVFLKNIYNIVASYCVRDTTPQLPENMRKLHYTGANDIEQTLLDVNFLIDCMVKHNTEHKKSNEFVCGTYDFLPNVSVVFIMRGWNKSKKTAAQISAMNKTWAEIEKGAWI